MRELQAELVATDDQIQALNPHLNLDTLEERCESITNTGVFPEEILISSFDFKVRREKEY